jgi:8-oxo-dGTP pyrophosphatase MutT (NUDIX family)
VHVLAEGRFLLEMQRATPRADGRMWDLPGGHAEAGETPAHTAVRELKEETGISVLPATLTMVDVKKREDGKLIYTFELKTVKRPPVVISNEHIGYRWRTLT